MPRVYAEIIKNLYSLNIADGTPTVYNKGIMDQETYKLELEL